MPHAHHHDFKHREAVLQRLSSEIMRECRDENSLHYVAQRVLNSPEVSADPSLRGPLQSLIAEREADLRERLRRQRAENADEADAAGAPPQTFSTDFAPHRGPSEADVRRQLHVLRHDFDEALIRFDLAVAGRRLAQLESLERSYGQWIPHAIVQRWRMDLHKVEQKRAELQNEVQSLSNEAVQAAARGDHSAAAKALGRLSSIHAARPHLLPEADLEALRRKIEGGGETFEHRQVSQVLVARERRVAAEIRKLAEAVHEFHILARQLPHEDPRYAEAEARYREVVRQVQDHDANWMADLMLELDDLLEELHDPTGNAETHVNRFLDSVRLALGRIQTEIRQVAADRGAV